MNICVFGASSDRLDKQYYHEAEAVGRLTAEYGHTLVFGGGKDVDELEVLMDHADAEIERLLRRADHDLAAGK